MNVGEGEVGLSLQEEWHIEETLVPDKPGYIGFMEVCSRADFEYRHMLEDGLTPQQARQVLPNALKTEICVCGFEEDWKHFFGLRCAKNAHPDMQVLAKKLKEQFIENKYI